MAFSTWRYLALSGLLASACFPPSDGAQPPRELIHFPVGLALSADGDRLYVANSNFDLRYRAGRVLALDAARVRELLPDFSREDPCEVLEPVLGSRTQKNAPELSVSPGICCPLFLNPGARGDEDIDVCAGRANRIGVDPFELVVDSVKVSAFSTDMIFQENPDGGWGRLFVPARGDATLHWLDVGNPDANHRELECGQTASDDTCDGNHRRGGDDDPGVEIEEERLEIEPFGLAAADGGRVIVTTHRTQGTVSLFLNDWDNGVDGGPRLADMVDGLPVDPLGIAAVPPSALELASDDYRPAFIVTYFQSPPVLQLFRYFAESDASDCGADPVCVPGPALRNVASTFITTTDARDSRGIGLDDTQRRLCEADCAGDDSCEADCATVPLGVYVANRSPAALLVGETLPNYSEVGTGDVPDLTHVVPVRTGPSRVVVGNVAGVPPERASRVFLVSFDSRFIYVYDPVLDVIEERILTGRGPHPFVVDSEHGLGYVGHFTDSNVGVIDLRKCLLGDDGEIVEPCNPNPNYAQIVLTIGQPTPPRTSK